jgi:hypothetical protein
MSVAGASTVESNPYDVAAGRWRLGQQALAEGQLLIFG